VVWLLETAVDVLVVTELGTPASVEQGPVAETETVVTWVIVTVLVTTLRLSRPATPLPAAMAIPKAAVAAMRTRLKNILMTLMECLHTCCQRLCAVCLLKGDVRGFGNAIAELVVAVERKSTCEPSSFAPRFLESVRFSQSKKIRAAGTPENGGREWFEELALTCRIAGLTRQVRVQNKAQRSAPQ
jgi:hypothetical protein